MNPLLLLLTLVSSSPLASSLGVEVEDVTGRQLEAALQTEEMVAVMFCKSTISCSQLFPVVPSCSQWFPVVPRPLGKLSQLGGLECFHFNLISAPQCCVTNTDKPLPPSPSARVILTFYQLRFELNEVR